VHYVKKFPLSKIGPYLLGESNIYFCSYQWQFHTAKNMMFLLQPLGSMSTFKRAPSSHPEPRFYGLYHTLLYNTEAEYESVSALAF
jgi:hypothetical protein